MRKFPLAADVLAGAN